MSEILYKDEVEKLVPHAGKMFLLDRVRNYDLETITITTEVDIDENTMFYDEELGGVPSWIAFEYMAQSISALSGIYGHQKNESPKVGFIMSVSNFKADAPVFRKGDVVTIEVHQTMRMDMAVTFDGKVFVGNQQVVTSTLNTVEVPDPKAALGL